MEETGESPQVPVPGWYADPEAVGGLRFWDGAAWTENRAPAPAPAPKVSGKAIAALVLGIVWVYGITSVIAIVFAVLAKREIKESNGWLTGGGMATAGLVLGIVGVVAIVAIVLFVVIVEALEGQR